jgi:hypothetical protein
MNAEVYGPLLAGVIVFALYAGTLLYLLKEFRTSLELDEPERLIWRIAAVFFPVPALLVWWAVGPHPLGLRVPEGTFGPRF